MIYTKKTTFQRIAALLTPKAILGNNEIVIGETVFRFEDKYFNVMFGNDVLTFVYAKLNHIGMSSKDAGTIVIGTADERVYIKLV